MKASGVLLHTIARALDHITGLTSMVYSPRPHLIPVEAKVIRDLVPRHSRHAWWARDIRSLTLPANPPHV
jgi:hypothetical protein